MENLPIPRLHRVTNNHFIPPINSIWISEKGNVVSVINTVYKKRPAIVSFKIVASTDKPTGVELSVSLHRFHSMFSSIE